MLEIKPIRDMTLTTTLAAIRAARPCEAGWAKLLGYLGKTRADDEPLPLPFILDSNGLDDTLWVLDKTMGLRRICALFAADCAEQVLPLFESARPNDRRPSSAIEVARDPNASAGEASAASAAATSAAWDAWDYTSADARTSATAAARAASDAAWAVTNAAARAAASSAERAEWAVSAAAAAAAANAAAGDAALGAAGEATRARLRQYLIHGEAAASMPWDTPLLEH